MGRPNSCSALVLRACDEEVCSWRGLSLAVHEDHGHTAHNHHIQTLGSISTKISQCSPRCCWCISRGCSDVHMLPLRSFPLIFEHSTVMHRGCFILIHPLHQHVHSGATHSVFALLCRFHSLSVTHSLQQALSVARLFMHPSLLFANTHTLSTPARTRTLYPRSAPSITS